MDVEKSAKPPTNGAHASINTPSDTVADNGNGNGNGVTKKMPDTVPDERAELLAQIQAMSPEEYKLAEKKLLRKMDLNIIPWITLLYLMSFLDRVNVGTAKLVGLVTQLNLTSLQYSNASMIFFVSYVAFEVPSNLVLRKLRPSRWIPFTMVCWSLFQIFMGLVTNYGQLLALRFMLGLFESGLFPGLNFFLTGWYRREEINRRASIFFAGAVLAGAFGGIFGFALSRMEGVGGKEGWTWIFVWEGVLTLLISIASFWMVHDWPDRAKFLNPLEREMVLYRLRAEQGLAGEGKLTSSVVWSALKDWKVYCLMLCYVGAAEPLYSGSLFSPTIIASLGSFSIPESLLLSAPPYALMFITTVVTAFLSDRWRVRGLFLMGWSFIAIIGYIMLMTVPFSAPGVLYFAVFVTAAAVGPLIGTTITWAGNTWGNHYKKAIAMGLVFSSGNAGGIWSSEAYRNKDAPRYLPGHATALAFCALNFITAGILTIYFRRENARRNKVYGPPPEEHEGHLYDNPEQLAKWGLTGMSREEIVQLGDKHPAWRYVL